MDRIKNCGSDFIVLDSQKSYEEEQPDLLLLRESDGQVIIAYGWNEDRQEWSSGKYYGVGSDALTKALQDFSEIEVEIEKEQRPTALIYPVESHSVYISQLDEKSQNNIERAVREFEAMQGYIDEEADDYIKEIMSERLWVLEDGINIVESEILPNTEITFSEGKRWYEQIRYEDKFKLMLEFEYPEVKDNPELQSELYELYMDDPYTRFFGEEIGEMFERRINEKRQNPQKQRQKEKTKDIELE